jgi:hypothetical protein
MLENGWLGNTTVCSHRMIGNGIPEELGDDGEHVAPKFPAVIQYSTVLYSTSARSRRGSNPDQQQCEEEWHQEICFCL